MTTTHTHRVARATTERAFSGSVAGRHGVEVPSAHGNVTYHQICTCGHARGVAENGMHRELGPWRAPVRTFVGQAGSSRGYYLHIAVDGQLVRAESAWEVDGLWSSKPCAVESVPAEALAIL